MIKFDFKAFDWWMFTPQVYAEEQRGIANAAVSGEPYKSERSKQNGAAFMVLLGEVNSVNTTYRLESQFAVSQGMSSLKAADLVYRNETIAAENAYRIDVFTAYNDYCDDYWRLTGRYNDAIATINAGGTVSLTHFETSSPNQAYGQQTGGENKPNNNGVNKPNTNGQSSQSTRSIRDEYILALTLAGRYMINSNYLSKPKSFPGASDVIFNHPSVQTQVMYAQEKIKRHFRDNPGETSYKGKIDFDFCSDNATLLEWGLRYGTLGYKVTRDGKEVTVTYTFYDDIDWNSWEVHRKRGSYKPESSWGQWWAANIEGSLHLVFDQLLQKGYHFSVSKTETFYLPNK